MFTMTRRQARLFRTLARRCLPKGRPRGPDPALTLVGGRAGPVAVVAVGDVTIGCRLPGPPPRAEPLNLPLAALAACEGADPTPVTFEPADGLVRITWIDRGQARSEVCPAGNSSDVVTPDAPAEFPEVGPAFLAAFHEAGRVAAATDTRYALDRVQVRGAAGQVVGSDGKQALALGGFRFAFPDDVLVPAVPVFGLKELARAGPVRAGRTRGGLCVGAGDWLVWLAADAAGRYPDVAGVARRHAGGAGLRVGDDDAARLLAGLPTLPRADEPYAPVTVELGPAPAVRAGAAAVRLAASACTGPPAAWTLNRAYLHRALLLGFRDFSAKSATDTAVANRGADTYLFALLAPDPADPAPPAAVSRVATPNGVSFMRPPDFDRKLDAPPDDEAPDPFAEAEAVRGLLGEAAARAGRLAGLLKNHRRQRKALEAAWASLQQLKLGQGG